MSPIIEGNVTYSNINYDQVLGRAQGDSDVNEAQGYDGGNIQFDFYTGDCSSYASPAGHACTTDNGSVGVCIDITPSLGSSSGNVFVCNPSSLGNSERIDAQATNQISVDLSASDSSSGDSSSGDDPATETRYYAIQTNGNPIHSSFCYDTCGDDTTACSDNDDCCLCNGANWLNYIFTEKPGTSVGSTAIEVTPISPRDDSNLPTSDTWVKITDPEAGNTTQTTQTTQTSDTTMRFFNIFDDAEPDVVNHDLFWTDTINRDANYMASQGTFLRESESDPVSYELVNESYTIQNFPGYIESSENSRVGRPGYYEECLYRSVLGEEGNRCACPLNYTPVESDIDSQIDNRLCAPCDIGSISDGIFESGESLTCEPCNTRGQVVNQDGECDHCRSENNLNRMYYEGECLDVGDAVIQSECVPIDPGAPSGCLETHHITGGSLDGTYNQTLSNFYIDCIGDYGLCKVEQSIIEGFGNIDPLSDNIQDNILDKNTTHDLYINEVCRSLPSPVCEMFQECSLDTGNNRCVLNLDDTQCFDTVKVPTPAQGDYQNILTLRNPSDTVYSCNYPSQENQQDTIVDGYVIPFMGNQVTQDTFTTQVTCDPLSESDIPGFVGEVKGFCLGEGQPIHMTGCIPGDVMNRLTLPTTTETESTLQNRCEELSETYPVSLLEISGYYHSETSDQMSDSGCYFQIGGGCDVTGVGGCEGATCECESGYYGDDCSEYCVASVTCSGNGTCNDVGECVCEGEWTGDDCGTDPLCAAASNIDCVNGTISGNMVEDNCACNCDDGYEGDTCETASACIQDEVTNDSIGKIHCQNGGQPTGTTGDCGCDCDDGYYGDQCQYSRTTTCNGRGDPGDNGICVCDDGWIDDGENQCFQCADNYYGDDCSVYCVASETCNDHGTCNSDGSCHCETEWGGSDCFQCADNYYGNECSEYCVASETCSGHGECEGGGSCDCETGYVGGSCQYSRSVTCNGNGSPNDDGSCNCEDGYGGPQCSRSRENYCNDHGEIQANGTCICDANFAGETCNTCATHHYGDDCITYCETDTNCGGNGTCNSEGGCDCVYNNSAGSSCQFTGGTTCNGHGTPDEEGNCTCDEGWIDWGPPGSIEQCSKYPVPNCTNAVIPTRESVGLTMSGAEASVTDDDLVCSNFIGEGITNLPQGFNAIDGSQCNSSVYGSYCQCHNNLYTSGKECNSTGTGFVCNSNYYLSGGSCVLKRGRDSDCSNDYECQSNSCTLGWTGHTCD